MALSTRASALKVQRHICRGSQELQVATLTSSPDVFAVGSSVYEIMTGHEPYEHLDSIDDMEEIEALIAAGKFPSTANVLAGNVIEGCWRQEYDSAKQCAKDVASIEADQVMSLLMRLVQADAEEICSCCALIGLPKHSFTLYMYILIPSSVAIQATQSFILIPHHIPRAAYLSNWIHCDRQSLSVTLHACHRYSTVGSVSERNTTFGECCPLRLAKPRQL